MNRKAALTILLTMLTLSIAFAVVAYTPNSLPDLGRVQHVDNLKQLTVSVPFVLGTGIHSNSTPLLNQPTRLEINNFVKSNPGVHFRGICDSLGLSVGVVQYHLRVLETANIITGHIDGQNKRYFEQGAFTKTDVTLISIIRHETAAKILTILSQNNSVLHKDIACSIGVSSQALTWHINQLKKTGLINAETAGINVKYTLNDANTIKIILNLTSNSKMS